MRAAKEIQTRMHEVEGTDFLGFQAEVLIEYLRFEEAREFLKEEARDDPEKAKKWNDATKPPTRENLLADMKEYMAFAWGKVEDHRGISAGRSVDKMGSWLWLLEDEEGLRKVKTLPRAQYGAPVLKYVSERYGFPMPDTETARRMMKGEPCVPGCDMGCGT